MLRVESSHRDHAPDFAPRSFPDVLAQFPSDQKLRAVDIATADGRFCGMLAKAFPDRFEAVMGVDICAGGRTIEKVGATEVITQLGTSFEAFVADQQHHGRFHLVILNAPPDQIIPQCFDAIPQLLCAGGQVIFTAPWHMLLTPVYNAFGEPEDVERYLREWGSATLPPQYTFQIITTLEGYPAEAARQPLVPGLLIASPLPRAAGSETPARQALLGPDRPNLDTWAA